MFEMECEWKMIKGSLKETRFGEMSQRELFLLRVLEVCCFFSFPPLMSVGLLLPDPSCYQGKGAPQPMHPLLAQGRASCIFAIFHGTTHAVIIFSSLLFSSTFSPQ